LYWYMERQRPFLLVRHVQEVKAGSGRWNKMKVWEVWTDQKFELLYLLPTMMIVYVSLSEYVDEGG